MGWCIGDFTLAWTVWQPICLTFGVFDEDCLHQWPDLLDFIWCNSTFDYTTGPEPAGLVTTIIYFRMKLFGAKHCFVPRVPVKPQ